MLVSPFFLGSEDVHFNVRIPRFSHCDVDYSCVARAPKSALGLPLM